jgi:D-amino peptidase
MNNRFTCRTAVTLLGVYLLALATSVGAAPWSLETPDYDLDDGLKILVYHDMEGLAGQDSIMSYVYGMPEYPAGREMLTADLNAVIEGLYQGGATEVHVVDAHGSLNPDPDIRSDLLDPRAQQVFRDQRFDSYIDLQEPGSYDAVVAVAMHAKTGSGGFASHTKTLGMEVCYGEQSVTESEMIALSWGEVGVPMIMVSGDDRLADDLSTMPWLEYVMVKTATGPDGATLRPVPEVHAELTAKAKYAVENLDKARVMKITTPVKVTVNAVRPASLGALSNFPGLVYNNDNSYSFQAENYEAAYRGAGAVINVARGGWFMSAMDRLVRDGNVATFNDTFMALGQEWIDSESGSRPPPQQPVARQYHGSE